MASISVDPLELDVLQPHGAAPEPLQIIKGSDSDSRSPSEESVVNRRGGPDDNGSSPPGPDRPLTVPKLRKRLRRSILTSSGSCTFEQNIDLAETVSPYRSGQEVEDNDTTPRANRYVPRIMSAGQCSKLDFRQALDNGMRSLRSHDQDAALDPSVKAKKDFSNAGPKYFKNKYTVLRAFGAQDLTETKPLSMPRKKLVGKHAKGERPSVIRMSSSEESSSLSSTTEDIGVAREPWLSPYTGLPSGTPLSSPFTRHCFPPHGTLCPRVDVTTEVSSVETTECFFWVAIEITGVLSDVNANTMSQPTSNFDVGSYGCLYDMRIDLIATRHSKVCEIFGDLHETKTVHAHQTHLILAKIRLAPIFEGIKRESAADLIADLESQLGGTSTIFMQVRLSYRHSAFHHHQTLVVTNMTAAIRRHDPQSAWSPQILQSMVSNPLIRLVKTYLPAEDAKEALRRLSAVAPANVLLQRIDEQLGRASLTVMEGSASCRNRDRSEPRPSKSDIETMVVADPARQIWTEMRKSSRTDHRPTLPDLGMDRIATGLSAKFTQGSTAVSPATSADNNVQQERSEILQLALRNKRSVGQDTLRSMAPSVRSRGKGFQSASLGFGFAWPFGWGRW